MRPFLEFVKTMVVGGLLFLFPLVVVTAIVGKAFGLMLSLIRPLGQVIAIDSVADVAVIDIVATVALLAGCFAAGLVAQSNVGRKIYRMADASLASLVPGYAALKARLGGTVGHDDRHATLKPVLVRFDDQSQMAFEIERLGDGRVTVFLPGAPDTWNGTAVVVDGDRVTPLDLEIIQVVRTLKNLGRGTTAVLGDASTRAPSI